MNNLTTVTAIIAAIVAIALIAGIIFLQIVLSKRQSKWPGLILPGIIVLISLAMLVGFTVYTSITTVGITVDGQLVEEQRVEEQVVIQFDSQTAIQLVAQFINLNIPTVILLIIYFVCRRMRRRRDLEKMSIQDLE